MTDDDLTPEQREFVNEITGQPTPQAEPQPELRFDSFNQFRVRDGNHFRVHDGDRWVTPSEMHVTNPFTGSQVTFTTTYTNQ